MKNRIKPKASKIRPESLKPKAKKVGKRGIVHNLDCPYCLSKLTVINGELACTGNQLKIWETEFSMFKTLNAQQQESYLDQMSSKEQFLELYELWLNGDLACDFSNKVYTLLNGFQVTVPDPIFVKKVEASLKRELLDSEKNGLFPIWEKNGQYYDEYIEGSEPVDIPMVTFPDDL